MICCLLFLYLNTYIYMYKCKQDDKYNFSKIKMSIFRPPALYSLQIYFVHPAKGKRP